MNIERAVAAATSTGEALGLTVDGAEVVHVTNRAAIRLLGCDVLVRVAPASHRGGIATEIEIARRLDAIDCPVGRVAPGVEPRVHDHDGFALTFWRFYEPMAPSALESGEYAEALAQLHAGMRQVADDGTPHFTDRVAAAHRLLDDPVRTPDLADADRELLRSTLRDATHAIADRDGAEQLLHGEPHPGNVLRTSSGLLFIDLETCCRGPGAFDIGHAPRDVAAHYPGADLDAVRIARRLMRAMVTCWRWDKDDRYPERDRWRAEGVDYLRATAR